MRYSHLAVEAPREPGDVRRECRVCGAEVTGVGTDIKHVGEEIRGTPVPREFLPAVRDCVAAVERALSQVTERATDAERARVAVTAVMEQRYLRAKRGKATPDH